MELTRELLEKETDRVIDAITSPVFLNQMQKFRATPVNDRFAMAAEKMTPSALRTLGAPVPEDMRVSSRIFEEGTHKNWPSVDMVEGQRILKLIQNKRPELLDALRINHPDIYEDIEPIRTMQTGAAFLPPRELYPANPGNGIVENDYVGPPGYSGCACGGAATVCAGAGGGS